MKTFPLTLLILANIVIWTNALHSLFVNFYQKSDYCFKHVNAPKRYRGLFKTFQYPDDQIVHNYVHCVSTQLELWNDQWGFDVEKISNAYRNRAGAEIVRPTVRDCNQSAFHRDKPIWCHRAFVCIMMTELGKWFRDDILSTRISFQNGVDFP